jgi:hypothetical protein
MNPEQKAELIKKLIEIYDSYILNKYSKEVKEKAQKLFFDYIYNNSIIDKNILNAVQGFEHIGWEYKRGLNINFTWKMEKEQAQEIAEKLKLL